MIRLRLNKLSSVQDAYALLQTAIGVEFGTLPPYLYAMFTIREGSNPESVQRIKSVVMQEMIHMCLACNILNALGGHPLLTPPSYPGPLPGDIGPDGGQPLTIRLYPFSHEAMQQAMAIEQPEDPPEYPVKALLEAQPATKAVTIGQFYAALDNFLATLPATDWTPHRNQIVDNQFFVGQLFAINDYADAHAAIQDIVSEGEGTKNDPLDFQHELAHYYRFGEIYHDRVLTKADNPLHYQWGPQKLGVDWSATYPAITDPGSHDFAQDPPRARAAQEACNSSYSAMVDALQQAVTGSEGALGHAVRAMFALRTAAQHAVTVPLADPARVAGPAFLYQSSTHGARR